MELVTIAGQVIFSATYEVTDEELKEQKGNLNEVIKRKLLRSTVAELTEGHNTGFYNLTLNKVTIEQPNEPKSNNTNPI